MKRLHETGPRSRSRAIRLLIGFSARATLFCLASMAGWAQNFTQRGYLETDLTAFPQTAPDDSSNFVGNAIFRWDLAYKLTPWLTFSGGIEAQTDTHLETERTFHLDWQDRGLLRPAFDLRSFKATVHKGIFTADLGKQFIRWGTADILNPTDVFAPRDYMNVVDNDFLGVLGARAVVEGGGYSVDMVVTRFTPSRMPLLDERWTVLPPDLTQPIENAATHFPGGADYGVRVKHVARAFEASASFFEGYNNLPLLASPSAVPAPGVSSGSLPTTIYIERFYPKIRMYGADAAVPFQWFTLKMEAAYFQGLTTQDLSAPRSDDYLLYVTQLERQVGEWTFVGGYAGQAVTEARGAIDFDPQRGLTRAFLGRIGYNIDSRRSIAFEGAERQNGAGTWLRAEYSHLLGSHWRATAEAVVIAGDSTDFLGQYHRNSNFILKIRYSF
jgi:hypothetical protein